MKIGAAIFFFLFSMSGGVLVSSIYDLSFMNYTICHSKSKMTEWKQVEMNSDNLDKKKKNIVMHEHLEVHVFKIIPHLLHGDQLTCDKKYAH